MATLRMTKSWLVGVAKGVAESLKLQSAGTPLHIRKPKGAITTNTDGWRAIIGTLAKTRVSLEIWCDKISGHPERRLYACFHASKPAHIKRITANVSKKLWPVRIVNQNDVINKSYMSFKEPLRPSEFNAPIRENYRDGGTFLGIYDSVKGNPDRMARSFYNRSIDFIVDVAHSFPHTKCEDENQEVFPQEENRKKVAAHLQRERSRLLASACKRRDKYRCQVCKFNFETCYGKLGAEFAEAHHIIPLSKLQGQIRTEMKDLITVCANCHRMLHRMDGTGKDIIRLKAIFCKNKD